MTLFQKKAWRLVALLSAMTIPIVSYAFSGGEVDKATKNNPSSNATAGDEYLTVETFALGEIVPPTQLDWYRGTIVPSKEADLGFRRPGRIDTVLVDEGDEVEKGALLATLDFSDVESKLNTTFAQIKEAEALLAELVAGPRPQAIASARSEVSRLEAVLALSLATADRQQNLLRSNASSVQQFDEARYSVQQNESALESARHRLSELDEGTRKEQIDAQRARVEVLRAQLETLKVELEDSKIVAPFDGYVSRRNVDEGTITNPQSTVLRLIQCDPLEGRFAVAPADARLLHVGDEATVTVDVITLNAVVARVEPELEVTSRTQTVFFTLPEAFEGGVVPGQTASLAISRRPNDSMWVPITSLSRAARGLWAVDVVTDVQDGIGIIERRQVQVVESDTELAKVAGSMLKLGDLIVKAGTNRITPGLKVSLGRTTEIATP